MTVDLDRALHNHFTPARAAELPAGSWERLETRLDAVGSTGDAGGGGTGRGRRRALLAAAVVVVVAGIGAVALVARDDDGATERLDVTDTSVPGTGTTAPSPEETSPEPGERPASVAILTDFDGDGFSEAAVLQPDGTRFTIVSEIDDAPAGVVHVDVAPDGVVFFEICCEPVLESVRAFDPAQSTYWGDGTFDNPTLDGGGPIITQGSFPEVSPDGSELVVSVPSGSLEARGSFRIVDLATGESRDVLDHGGEETEVNGISWSPDGTHLAVERLRYGRDGVEEVTIDLVSLADGTSTPVPLPQGGAVLPDFLPDGRLAVVLGGRDADGETRSGTVALIDPAAPGGVPAGGMPAVRGASPVIALDVSADGTWIVATGRDGTIRTLSTTDGLREEDPWPETPANVVAAAW